MYRNGHYGAALLIYAPIGTLTLILGFGEPAVAGGIATVGLATAPDLDMKIPRVKHRGVTHTVHFAAVVGILCGAVATAGAASSEAPTGWIVAAGAFGFLTGAGAIGSHIAADALTPMGVEPLGDDGPHYSFDFVRADNTLANYALLALGIAAVVAGVSLAGAVGAGV
ncbi:metal-dependent hydrolase [Halorubrum sp. RMP-47]|uniref:Metal-dependent hydrolase n=1 Tax=Halorubrum miltondacostae TaxID=3076378 RepID=A0ABD5M6J5_9EURY